MARALNYTHTKYGQVFWDGKGKFVNYIHECDGRFGGGIHGFFV